ncbi:hypothetical protein [Streptomyces sp. NPDC015130]|uniref:hypothetical protein n=1 Tax=Streptomyces sp. NPDC015130 TaxID=3364940 RepID=UPI0036FC7BED
MVVDRGFFDPVWCVYVQQGRPPLERRWTVDCFESDFENDFDGGVRSEAVWTGPERIRMTTGDGASHEVTIGQDGRPGRIVSAG